MLAWCCTMLYTYLGLHHCCRRMQYYNILHIFSWSIYVPLGAHGETPSSFFFHRRPLWSSLELGWKLCEASNQCVHWMDSPKWFKHIRIQFYFQHQNMPVLFVSIFLGRHAAFCRINLTQVHWRRRRGRSGALGWRSAKTVRSLVVHDFPMNELLMVWNPVQSNLNDWERYSNILGIPGQDVQWFSDSHWHSWKRGRFSCFTIYLLPGCRMVTFSWNRWEKHILMQKGGDLSLLDGLNLS